MIIVDCSRAQNYESELAFHLSRKLEGRALVLIRGSDIVFDEIGGRTRMSVEQVRKLVVSFLRKRVPPGDYEVTNQGERVQVLVKQGHKAGRAALGVPPNLLVCPHCGYATPYESLYNIHVRIHYV